LQKIVKNSLSKARKIRRAKPFKNGLNKIELDGIKFLTDKLRGNARKY
jgi:hypothetical protein